MSRSVKSTVKEMANTPHKVCFLPFTSLKHGTMLKPIPVFLVV